LKRIIIDKKTAAGRLGVSITTLWRLQKAGLLQKCVRVSPGRVGLYDDEVNEFIATRERV
jgi:predicted site-specific integrase-resolvase